MWCGRGVFVLYALCGMSGDGVVHILVYGGWCWYGVFHCVLGDWIGVVFVSIVGGIVRESVKVLAR